MRLRGDLNADTFKIIDDTDHEDFLKHVFRQYQYWGKPIYFITDVKKHKSGFANVLSRYSDTLSVHMTSKYKSNKNNDSYFTVYLYQPDSLPVWDSDNTYPSNNLIINGDMEDVLSSDEISQKFRKWTDDNAFFYKSDYLKLPFHQALLATWDTYKFYPELYLDEQLSFEGKYSLHVKLFDPAIVYLMNKVPAHPGKFSFRIKNLKQTTLSLSRYDYKPDGKLAYPDFVYYFCLADQQIHSFSVDFKQEDFLGDYSIFLLTGDNSEFLLDNISYCEE